MTEGRTHLVCADCGRTCDIAGEMPDEYRGSFFACIQTQGWVPRPWKYEGSETHDDAEKI